VPSFLRFRGELMTLVGLFLTVDGALKGRWWLSLAGVALVALGIESLRFWEWLLPRLEARRLARRAGTG
jgi:hypothetical protein